MPRHGQLRTMALRSRSWIYGTARPGHPAAADRAVAAVGSPAALLHRWGTSTTTPPPRRTFSSCLANARANGAAPFHRHRVPVPVRQLRKSARFFHSEAEYHRVADETLRAVQDAIDEAFERYDDGASGSSAATEYELNVASGVLTLSLPGRGTWVLNKQTPNQQIWWSSPLSGPKRFEYLEGAWCSTKDGLALGPLLVQELRHVHPRLEIEWVDP